MDARTRRRRAVLAVLDGQLPEADLLAALWLAHDQLGSDAVTDTIRFVDALGERFGLEPAVCKRLYGQLHAALRSPDAALPADPWPQMQALQRAAVAQAPAFAPAFAPAGAPGFAPAFAAPHAPVSAPAVPPAFAPAPSHAYPAGAYPSDAGPPDAGPPGAGPPAAQPIPVPAARVADLPAAPAGIEAAPPPAAGAAPVGPAGHGPSADGRSAAADAAAAVAVAVATPGAGAGPGRGADAAAGGLAAAWHPDGDVPAPQAVFAEVVAGLAAEVAQAHAAAFADWREAVLPQVLDARQRQDAGLRERLQAAVAALQPEPEAAAALRAAWQLPLPVPALGQCLTQLYVALCEALGPVAADQVLTRAVRRAEQGPAARVFSPRRLL